MRRRPHALYQVGALVALLLVVADHAQVLVRHVGIEHDDAAVHVLDVLLEVLVRSIAVLVVRLGDAVGEQEPRQLQLARRVRVHHRTRHERRQLGAGLRHVDGHGLQTCHPRTLPGVNVAIARHDPGEGQLLA